MSNLHVIDKERYRPHFALVAGAASFGTVVVLIAAKLLAYVYTSSPSVFASLMDSIVDATGSAMSFFAIHMSLKPPDRNHRSGHGKIEGLAAILQALLIAGGGASLLVESARHFYRPHTVDHAGLAIGVMIFSIAMSLLLVALQRRVLKHAPSLAVESDKVHYMMDVMINGGVIAVLVALKAGAPGWCDAGFALVVSLYLGFTAKQIAGKGLDMLLDRELPGETRRRILETIEAQDGVLGVHDLRTSQSGMRIFISFDIEADPLLSLRAAHEISRRVEQALLNAFANADIMIHVDPHGDTEDSRHQAVDRRN